MPPADDNDEESSSSLEDEDDDDDNDDDGEDLFNIEELQEIYEKQMASQSKESKPMEEGCKEMDTSKATEEPEKLVKPKAVPTKQKTIQMVRVKKSEHPRVEKSTVPTFHIPEPVMTRARGKEKTWGEQLLEEFERVEAKEKVKKAKEEAKKGSEDKTTEETEGEAKKSTQMEGKHHRRTQSKAEQTSPRKPGDLEKMDTEELEGPSSR